MIKLYEHFKMENIAKHISTLKEMFNEEEFQSFIDQWKHFGEITGTTSRLEDHKKCLQWDKKMLAEFIQRRKDGNFDWWVKLILLDYERAIAAIQDDFSLNEDYFHFLWTRSFIDGPDRLKEAINQLKRVVNLCHKPEVIRFAARWFYEISDVSEAKNVLFEGLKLSKNDDLYVDVLDIVMENLDHPNFNSDIHKLVDVMVENQAHIDLFKGLIDTLENLGNNNVSDKLIDHILQVLIQRYQDEPETYHLIALRELKGKPCPSTAKSQQNTDTAIDRCNKIYKRGLKLLSEEKRKSLWKLYINTFVSIVNQYSNTTTENLLKIALEDFEEIPGLEYDMPLIKLYLKYFPERENVVNDKLQQAASSDTTTMPLWITCITYFLSKSFNDNEEKIKTALDKASVVLGNKVIKLYDLYFTYLEINIPEYAEPEYLRVLGNGNLHEDVLGELKVKYLSYSILKVRERKDPKQMKDIMVAFHLYKKLASSPPYHRDLHTEIIRAAETCIEGKDLSTILDEAIELWKEQFGTSDPEPYLHKMERIMYQISNERKAFVQTDCKEIYEEAINTLNGTAKKYFIQSYNKKVEFYERLEKNSETPPASDDSDYCESESRKTGKDQLGVVHILD